MERKEHFSIFTTASLPWMTGTAVNPLFRTAYLSNNSSRTVTLVIPWLSLTDQNHVYPNKITFSSPSEQEAFVRQWLEERINFKSNFSIKFYPGKFSLDKRSILPVGDITDFITDEEADIAILEEPEHLTWYHHGKGWKTKFRLVIGIIHTNYLEYVRREKNGWISAFLLKHINRWVVGMYCHKVIRLSAATQDLPRSVICNVNGVNPKFLEIGKRKNELQQNDKIKFCKGAYYIGKMVWSKGYKELIQLLRKYQKELTGLEIDLHGNGEDSYKIEETASKLDISVRIYPGKDHADPVFHDYKVFLNPSTSDVVCTTTAEALAMGKIVVCADHPSNQFFKDFANCRMYKNDKGFVEATCKALVEDPLPLTHEDIHRLSWESATERLLGAISQNYAPEPRLRKTFSKNFMSSSLNMEKKFEDASAYVHYVASGFEASRRAFGAIPGSLVPDEGQSAEMGLSYSSHPELELKNGV